jgi:hypothetical protein
MVLFGAQSSSRILSAGYTVNWSSSTATSDLYLLDLNPSLKWVARIDAGQPVALGVSSQGIASLTASGAGPHTLQLEVLAGVSGPGQGTISTNAAASPLGASAPVGMMALASSGPTASGAPGPSSSQNKASTGTTIEAAGSPRAAIAPRGRAWLAPSGRAKLVISGRRPEPGHPGGPLM